MIESQKTVNDIIKELQNLVDKFPEAGDMMLGWSDPTSSEVYTLHKEMDNHFARVYEYKSQRLKTTRNFDGSTPFSSQPRPGDNIILLY